MSNLIKYQFVDLHPSDTVKINNNDKKDNFIPLGKDGGILIETIGQQEAEKAILSLQKKENNEAKPENISEEEYERTKEEAEFLIEEAKKEAEQMRSEASRQINIFFRISSASSGSSISRFSIMCFSVPRSTVFNTSTMESIPPTIV